MKWKNVIIVFLVIFFSLFLITCQSNYYRHSWLNYSDESDELNWDDFYKNKTIKEYYNERDIKIFTIWQYNINVEIINEEYKNKYIMLLQNDEFVEITYDEANKISYNNFNNGNKRYFIVRALYPLKGGIYSIYFTKNSNLYIYYNVMARRDYELVEDVLIIEVEEKPNNLYISFGITS